MDKMNKFELNTDKLDNVAGGMSATLGGGKGPHFPPSTGPTIPVDPIVVIKI